MAWQDNYALGQAVRVKVGASWRRAVVDQKPLGMPIECRLLSNGRICFVNDPTLIRPDP